MQRYLITGSDVADLKELADRLNKIVSMLWAINDASEANSSSSEVYQPATSLAAEMISEAFSCIKTICDENLIKCRKVQTV